MEIILVAIYANEYNIIQDDLQKHRFVKTYCFTVHLTLIVKRTL